MKLSTYYPTLTYTEGDFLIDIVYNTEKKCYESWLYHKDYGVKKHMFSTLFKHTTLEEFVHTFVNELLPTFIKEYKREVMDNV